MQRDSDPIVDVGQDRTSTDEIWFMSPTGPAATNSFARLFLASGAQHCASAAGPAPTQPVLMNAPTGWVEHGAAPASILGTTTDPATNVVIDSRPLCLYPKFARYTGHGSTTDASSYVCAK